MKHPFRIVLGWIALLPIVVGDIVHAQEPPPDSSSSFTSPEILVEAFRAPVSGDSVAYSVTAIDASQRTVTSTGLTLDDVLAEAPGIQVDNRYNFALGDRISMRGFGARAQFGVRGVRIVADGISATFADGQSALEAIDPATIESVEVLGGPASALYGNASGGVIALRTMRPSDAPVEQRFKGMAGDDGLLRFESGVGGTIGATSYRIAGSYLGYDGYREFNTARNYRVNGELTRRFDESELRVRGGYTDFTADNPGALSQAMLDSDRTQAVPNNVRQQTGKEGSQGEVGVSWRQASEGTTLELSGDLRRRSIFNPIPNRIIDLSRTAVGARVVVGSTLVLFNHALVWSGGGDVDAQFDERSNHVNREGAPGDVTLDQTETVTGIGAFLSASTRIATDLRAMGSLRYDRSLFDVKDRFIGPNDPDDSGDRTMDSWSPSFGLLWTPDRVVNLFANVSTAFETPTTTELANRPSGAGGFNPDLQPQRTLSLEVGARGLLPAEIRYQIAAYRADIRDELIPFQSVILLDRDFYRNAGSSVHQGIEAGLRVSPVAGMRAMISYAYTDARFDSYRVDDVLFDGNRVPGVAPHRLSARLSYLASFGLYVGLEGRYTAETAVNDANSEFSAAYTTVDATCIWQEGLVSEFNGWQARFVPFVGVDNIFDVEYNAAITVNAFGGRYYEPGPGRSFNAGIEITLGPRPDEGN